MSADDISPPLEIIVMARDAARQSLCSKSQRGVVIYRSDRPTLHPIAAFNFRVDRPCMGTQACRDACAKVCIHAEMAALRKAEATYMVNVALCDLAHVKVVDGEIVPGGGPSCWQCSRRILDAEIRGVWLYQEAGTRDRLGREVEHPKWCRYSALEFHWITLDANGLPR